jgi:ATP-dependent RNA helicase HelY
MISRQAIRNQFDNRCDFELDSFQVNAMDALDRDDSVLVVAPTGAGKTLVGEYAVHAALMSGNRAFYTTPMKALSNQKFNDLSETYGQDNVGLLTGDNVINGDAPIVVMTTEVLRNMIYAQSSALNRLQYVVLDEVHYLQNAYRGPVWEEVIIHTPPEVTLVCLSATVSNAEELSDWIRTVRGSTVAIIEERRPVELQHHYLAAPRRNAPPQMIPTFTKKGKANPKGIELDPPKHLPPWKRTQKHRPRPPARADVVELLEQRNMLPAIYFIFSRNGCEDAVSQCINANILLTTPEETLEIRQIAENAVAALAPEDLEVLEYNRWLKALERGIAAHHAGMVTPFKEAVEECFSRGLTKAVFATETLALGINMPARTVVVEKLSKFTGERHQQLTPGEFTQLTGRAGRRGIDELGHAVVLWSNYVTFDQVAKLAAARTYKLTSSFRPTYNMAANLIQRYQPNTARHLLNLSFAQFLNDADIVRLEARLDNIGQSIDTARTESVCELGDVGQWRAEHLNPVREVAEDEDTEASRKDIAEAVGNLEPGDIINGPASQSATPLLIISTTQRRSQYSRLGVLDPDGHRFTLNVGDFQKAPVPVHALALPKPYNPSNKDFIKRALERFAADLGDVPVDGPATGPGACPEIRKHLEAFDALEVLDEEHSALEKRIKGRSESLARQFDRVLAVLEHFEYTNGWALTDAGVVLSATYHESDLLVAECNRRGHFDGLNAAELAAVVSFLTFEARGPGGREDAAVFPTKTVRKCFAAIEATWQQISSAELDNSLPMTRSPDAGFCNHAYNWAEQVDLQEMLGDDEAMSGGDFVRNTRQLIDLLAQIGNTAVDPATGVTAREAVLALNRDVVAAASAVHVSTPPKP